MLKKFYNVSSFVLFGVAFYILTSGKFPVHVFFLWIAFSDIFSLKVSIIELKEELAKLKNKV